MTDGQTDRRTDRPTDRRVASMPLNPVHWQRIYRSKHCPQSGNEVKNVDDWKELDAIQATVDVEWKWVEAHKGIHGNEMADRLANEGAGNKR